MAQRPLAPTVASGGGDDAVVIWRVPGGAVKSAHAPARLDDRLVSAARWPPAARASSRLR